jgi:hypothetical protein
MPASDELAAKLAAVIRRISDTARCNPKEMTYEPVAISASGPRSILCIGALEMRFSPLESRDSLLWPAVTSSQYASHGPVRTAPLTNSGDRMNRKIEYSPYEDSTCSCSLLEPSFAVDTSFNGT